MKTNNRARAFYHPGPISDVKNACTSYCPPSPPLPPQKIMRSLMVRTTIHAPEQCPTLASSPHHFLHYLQVSWETNHWLSMTSFLPIGCFFIQDECPTFDQFVSLVEKYDLIRVNADNRNVSQSMVYGKNTIFLNRSRIITFLKLIGCQLERHTILEVRFLSCREVGNFSK